MRKTVFLFAFAALFCNRPAVLTAEEMPPAPFFTWDFLLTGSWSKSFKSEFLFLDDDGGTLFHDGSLVNRGEVRLGIPRLRLDFRFEAIDRRKLPHGAADPFYPGIGVYFGGYGVLGKSRLLHGVIEESGLPARIKSLWAKSPPFAELRRPSWGELKFEPSTAVPETYLYVGFPSEGPLTGFAFFQMDNELFPACGGGVDFSPGRIMNLRVEGFYTQKTLKGRKSRSWFSANPPLPDRDFRLFAFAALLETPAFGAAADAAFSETFAFGRDFYGNAAVRLGGRPWKFSFVIDGAGSRFAGRDGGAAGGGLRLACSLEKSWTRSGLFKLNSVLRSSGNVGGFDRFSLAANFRPSSPQGNPVFRLAKVSLFLNRSAVIPRDTGGSLEAAFGFNLYALRLVLSGKIDTRTETEDSQAPLFRPPFFESFHSSRIALEGSWGYRSFNLRIVSGYTFHAEKDGIADISLAASLSWPGLGRLSVKVAASDFPVTWNYALTWRVGRFSF